MQAHEQTEFLRAISLFIKEQVIQATVPLLLKIEDLEAQIVARPIIDEGNLVELTSDVVMKSLPKPQDGKDADLTQIEAMIKKEGKEQLKLFVQDVDFRFKQHDETTALYVNEAIGKLPKPKDGIDGKDVSETRITDIVHKMIMSGRECGLLADWDDVTIQLKTFVEEKIAELPKPKDGKDGADGKDGENGPSVSLDDLRPLVAATVTQAVAALPRPVDVVDCVLDRDGNLCLTFSNGTVKQVGRVVGKDGKDIDPEFVRIQIREMVDAIEKPTNGKDGKDGKDGIGFPHISLEQIDDRHFELVITNEDKTQERRCQFELRQQIHRGVWKEGSYERDDRVTWNGSEWIARRDTQAPPGIVGNVDWMLTVKCGRDGKKGDQGPPGIPGKNGDNGRDGRDLTQMGFDGKKW
jgi:hypothetical protein